MFIKRTFDDKLHRFFMAGCHFCYSADIVIVLEESYADDNNTNNNIFVRLSLLDILANPLQHLWLCFLLMHAGSRLGRAYNDLEPR